MPVPADFGVYASKVTGGGGGATFVGASTIAEGTGGSVAIPFPGSPQVGDVAIIMCWAGFSDTASISGGAGGWTKDTITWNVLSYFSSVFFKVLAAPDLGGVTLNNASTIPSGSTVVVAVYRGPTAAAVKTRNAGEPGTSLTLGGFTKNASCKAIVTFAQDRDPTSNPNQPGIFVMRAGPGGFGFFSGNVADVLTPASYTNGTNIVWTNFDSTERQIGWAIELT